MRSFYVNAFRSLKLNYKPKQLQTNTQPTKKKKNKISEDDSHWIALCDGISPECFLSWENFSIIHSFNLLSHYVKPIAFVVVVATNIKGFDGLKPCLIALNDARLITIHSTNFNTSFQRIYCSLGYTAFIQCSLLCCCVFGVFNASQNSIKLWHFCAQECFTNSIPSRKFTTQSFLVWFVFAQVPNTSTYGRRPLFLYLRSNPNASISLIYVVFVFLPKHNYFDSVSFLAANGSWLLQSARCDRIRVCCSQKKRGKRIQQQSPDGAGFIVDKHSTNQSAEWRFSSRTETEHIINPRKTR